MSVLTKIEVQVYFCVFLCDREEVGAHRSGLTHIIIHSLCPQHTHTHRDTHTQKHSHTHTQTQTHHTHITTQTYTHTHTHKTSSQCCSYCAYALGRCTNVKRNNWDVNPNSPCSLQCLAARQFREQASSLFICLSQSPSMSFCTCQHAYMCVLTSASLPV